MTSKQADQAVWSGLLPLNGRLHALQATIPPLDPLIAASLAKYVEARKMSHVRGAPMHPQPQGKIEAFVEHYDHQRYPESLNNLTPADASFGRVPAIIKQRERIKQQTIEHRRLLHRKLTA
jgi:hypothetical protein